MNSTKIKTASRSPSADHSTHRGGIHVEEKITITRTAQLKTKRKKRYREKFTRNVAGKVIDGVHELYTLTMGMMLGIRCSVNTPQLRHYF